MCYKNCKPIVATILISLFLASCATPITTMKHPQTGQIVRCGGDPSGSMAGGLIGYNIQKGADDRCVKDYESHGFRRISVQE